MPSPTTTYQKFPAKGAPSRGFGLIPTKNTIWFGEDHLLLLRRTGFIIDFHESYKRFYYGDIRGVTIERKADWIWRAGILGAAAILILIGAAWVWSLGSLGGGIFISLLDLVFIYKALSHLFRGPSCLFKIFTAAQTEEISCLNRLSKAHEFIARLRPLIDSAQGALPSDQILVQASGSAATAAAGKVQPPAPPLNTYSGWMHLALYSLMLIGALLNILFLLHPHVGFRIASSILVWIGIILLIACLVRQSHSTLSSALKKVTWGSISYYAYSAIVGISLQFWYSFNYALKHPGQQLSQTEMYSAMYTDIPNNPFFKWFILGALILGLAWGLPGLFLLLRHYMQRKHPSGS